MKIKNVFLAFFAMFVGLININASYAQGLPLTFQNGGNSFGNNATLGTNDNFSLIFETNNTERARLNTSGNFGIGTNNPTSTLHVVGVGNITGNLDIGGTITSGLWNGTLIDVLYGGTGQSSYTDGQLLIGNSTGNTLSKATLTAGTGISITNGAGSITISSTAASGAPSDATYITQTSNATLTNEQALSSLATGYMKVTTGTGVVSSQATPIPVADGGTGAITLGDAGVLIGNGTGAVNVTSSGTAGQVLTSNGAGVDPTFQAAAGGGTKVAVSGAAVTLANDNETTIVSQSIAGGTLGTSNAIKITLYVTNLTLPANNDITIRLKYGATTLVTSTIEQSNTEDNAMGGLVTIILFANGATNAQSGYINQYYQRYLNPGEASDGGDGNTNSGTAAEDSTGDLNLVVTAQRGGSAIFSIRGYIAELVK